MFHLVWETISLVSQDVAEMTFYHNRGKDDTTGFARKKTTLRTFVVLLCFLGGLLFLGSNHMSCKDTAGKLETRRNVEDDWFDGNITSFQNKADAYSYIVLRKTAIGRYGDFSCHSSQKKGMCAFKVETIIEAIQICNAYAEICTGFVLTKDMNIRLMHQVRRLSYNDQTVTFIKTAFVSRIGYSVAEAPQLYARKGISKT